MIICITLRYITDKIIMPPPRFVTRDIVFSAADRLLKQGMPFLEITNIAIRAELGKGSMEHIQPLLRDWKTDKAAQKGLEIDIPDLFKTELIEFGAKLWGSAAREAEKKVEGRYEDYKRVKKELSMTNEVIDSLDGELEDNKASVSALNEELKAFKEAIKTHRRELSVCLDYDNKEKHLKELEDRMEAIELSIEGIIAKYLVTDVAIKSIDDSGV